MRSADKNAKHVADGQPGEQQIEMAFSSDIRTAMKSRNIIFLAIKPPCQGGKTVEPKID
jgi:hypothetical protein